MCLCSTLQMLTNIENRLEELFQQIELLPPDKVEAAEKVKICMLTVSFCLTDIFSGDDSGLDWDTQKSPRKNLCGLLRQDLYRPDAFLSPNQQR